jgi:putative lipoprotein
MTQPTLHFPPQRRRLRVAAIAIALSLPLFVGGRLVGAEPPPAPGMITGTVSYLQRIALAPEAIISVSLRDNTLADAPSKLLVEQRFSAAGRQVPIPFRLPYDPASIDPTHRYTLRAVITLHRKLLFTTSAAYPILTGSAPRTADLVLKAVEYPAKPAVAAVAKTGGPAAFENTHWKLTELGGAPVIPLDSKHEAYLVFRAFNHHISGTGGCNRLIGTYDAGSEQALKLKMGAMTRMACPEPLMVQEKNLLEALGAVTNYRLDGDKLELRKGDQVLVRLESRVKK